MAGKTLPGDEESGTDFLWPGTNFILILEGILWIRSLKRLLPSNSQVFCYHQSSLFIRSKGTWECLLNSFSVFIDPNCQSWFKELGSGHQVLLSNIAINYPMVSSREGIIFKCFLTLEVKDRSKIFILIRKRIFQSHCKYPFNQNISKILKILKAHHSRITQFQQTKIIVEILVFS